MSGKKRYNIEYLASVIKEDFSNLPTTVKNMIQRAIEERLMIDPIS